MNERSAICIVSGDRYLGFRMMEETIAGGIDGFTGRAGDDFIVGIDYCVDTAYIFWITGLGVN